MKPEMPRDATLARVSRETRYTFVLLWTVADDDGLFVATPRALLGALYPHDPDISEATLTRELDRLREIGRLRAFDTPDGIVGEIVNFGKHQKLDHRSKPYLANLSRNPRETFAPGVLSLGVLSPEPRVRSQESGAGGTSRTPTDDGEVSEAETELFANLPPACHDDLNGLLRAAQSRRAVAAAIRGIAPGGVQESNTWAEVAVAIQDLAAASDPRFEARRFRIFARKVRDDAQGRGPGGDTTLTPAQRMALLADQEVA